MRKTLSILIKFYWFVSLCYLVKQIFIVSLHSFCLTLWQKLHQHFRCLHNRYFCLLSKLPFLCSGNTTFQFIFSNILNRKPFLKSRTYNIYNILCIWTVVDFYYCKRANKISEWFHHNLKQCLHLLPLHLYQCKFILKILLIWYKDKWWPPMNG